MIEMSILSISVDRISARDPEHWPEGGQTVYRQLDFVHAEE